MNHLDMYNWQRRFVREGLTPMLRMELRDLLSPQVQIGPPFQWGESEKAQNDEPERIADIVSWEIVLGADHVHLVLKELNEQPRWRNVLHELLPDATALLRDALDLMRELDGADDRHDGSYSSQPSIARHEQNRQYDDWTALIELTRDAWVASADRSPEIARLEVERWLQISYPVFRRLAFFAATETNVFPPDSVLDWLLADSGWWLWSNETMREAMRLLLALTPRLTLAQRERLERAILDGPPQELFQKGIEPERFERIINHEIWLRLTKFRSSGAALSVEAATKLNGLSDEHPDWHLEPDDRDEFPVWTGIDNSLTQFQVTPKPRRELEHFLRALEQNDPWNTDDWRDRCLNDFPRAATALISLALQGYWPVARWRAALQAWSSSEAHAAKSWRHLHQLLITAPDEVVKEIAHALSWWLQLIAKVIERHEGTFFALVLRILAVHRAEDVEDAGDIIFRAINHPVGQVTDATLQWWYRQRLQDDQGLPEEVAAVFSVVCYSHISVFRYGRSQLATNAIALFRVDQRWTKEHLLGFFNWKRSPEEARAVWMGFLVSPRLYRPIIAALKSDLLATAQHYARLNDLGRQYASLLTFSALELDDLFLPGELTAAAASLPDDGLAEAARSLVQALEGASEQRAEYWRNRIVPYLNRVWPRDRDRLTTAIANQFAKLCVSTGDAFPEAVEVLREWTSAANDPNSVIVKLNEAQLATRFPQQALALLDDLVGDNDQWVPLGLQQSLDAIGDVQPQLRDDPRFRRLLVFLRRRNA